MRAFSPSSFAKQLSVPGIVAFRAANNSNTTLGMTIWYRMGEIAYYHLGAYALLGYESHASYALFWTAINHFSAAGLRWLDLGASAGLQNNDSDGLSQFKRGWSTGTRTAYLCGRILDPLTYARLTERHGAVADYFPAYHRHDQT
jgi:hypothetical protein